jgi:hypothetical protein
MSEVRLELRGKIEPSPSATLSIPRSYVVFASGYRQPQAKIIPAQVTTSSAIAILRVSSKAAHVAAWREAPPLTTPEKDQVREDTAEVFLYPSFPTFTWTGVESLPSGHRVPRPSVEGFDAYAYDGDALSTYYYSPQPETFGRITCYEVTQPLNYCQYEFKVCPTLRAVARFVDFRFNGGEAFARERISVLQSTIRQWVQSCGEGDKQ